jgi:hypothetical protein
MSTAEWHILDVGSPARPSLGKRVGGMAVTWAFLGATMGASAGGVSGGFVGAIAGVMAGAVELAVLGAALGVIGGRPGESLLGGACGAAGGVIAALVGGHPSPVLTVDFGLVVGALVGATLKPYCRVISLPIFLLRRLCPQLGTAHRLSRLRHVLVSAISRVSL